ncbi:MAG: AarF/ABC1/UbiB kinase family protein [Victivallales bacterium]|nr:AarF/ABC1/UbiB kinase family protein [Victivallales bacterium]
MADLTTIRNITRTYLHIQRYRQIAGVLLRNGFGYLFSDLHLASPSTWYRKRPESEESERERMDAASFPGRLRKTLMVLGPTFVKLGQVLSCRPDILPMSVTAELAKLRDQVEPFPFEEVRRIVNEDFGTPLEQLFSRFDETPVGAASMAQGHHAVLKDGSEVFVKIQRPNIRRGILVDLEILAYFARQLEENMPELSFLRPTRVVAEFAATMKRELDFTIESSNMLCFARQFEGNAEVVIPRPKRELCSPRVLTMDYLRGIRGDDVEGMRRSGIDLKAVADLGVRLLMQQIFDFGYFHADPHGGNMFILPGPKICYVDFGVMGRLTQDERMVFGKLLTEVLGGNLKAASKLMLTLMSNGEGADLEEVERGLQAIVEVHIRQDLAHINVVQLVQDFYAMCYQQKLCLKPHIYNMMRALGYADDMGRRMAPDFEIFRQLQPFITKITTERLNPLRTIRHLLDVTDDWGRFLEATPVQLKSILRQLKSGELALHHSLEDMPEFNHTLGWAFNRLCVAIVLAAMLLSSALLVGADKPPYVFGVSLWGILGFLGSFILGGMLAVSLWRSGK